MLFYNRVADKSAAGAVGAYASTFRRNGGESRNPGRPTHNALFLCRTRHL